MQNLSLMITIDAVVFRYRKDGDVFVGWCDQLGFAAEGDSFDEFQQNAIRLLGALVSQLSREGTLVEYLQERGVLFRIEPVIPPSPLLAAALPRAPRAVMPPQPSIPVQFEAAA